jgi:HlyD family secretion protein
MRQIAKWTLLCAICTAFGFAATYGVANSDRVLQTVAAMLPAPSQSQGELLTVQSELPANASAIEVAAGLAAKELSSKAPLVAANTTGTMATGNGQLSADAQQNIPTTGPLSAVGVIEVTRDRQVVLGASGRVDEIAVEVGDPVSAGDLLIALDTTYLDWAVEQAELNFEAARIDFEEAGKLVDDADIAVAEANLLLAQENLAEVEAGPTAETLAAAESAASAAWARVTELQAGPNANEMIIAQAALRRAEIAVEAAQREYDKIAWLPEAAATSAADNLQQATIALEAARATYAESTQPATDAEIQAAVASAQSAQASLNDLLLRPTPAELAAAQASVAQAEAALEEINKGPQQASVRKAELGVRQAMIALEDARLAQTNAQVVAPINGTILAVNVDLGQQASAGSIVATLADTADVKLTVNVEQRDISRIVIGQQVQIAIYALPSDTFSGVVEQIAPIAEAGTGFITFPVIIRFTDGPMDKILPGMTASATFTDSETPAAAATPAATQEATPAATAEAEEEATPAATEEATEEAATEEATEEPTEEPEATATPSN